jgi:MinD superfamily P-loop ATPase
VTIPVPEVDEARCTHCGRCGEFCQFSAIVCLGSSVLTFPDLCHGCGGCILVCPERAICEVPREIGEVEEGRAGRLAVLQGRLRIGQAISPPLIRAVKRKLPPEGIAILDAPPGTACPMIETVRGVNFVLLVTEPTPFGLHDLTLAVEAIRQLGIPMGVVVNRAAAGRNGVRHFCGEADLPILLEIPDERRIAVAYSRGDLAVEAVPPYREWMELLYEGIRREATA